MTKADDITPVTERAAAAVHEHAATTTSVDTGGAGRRVVRARPYVAGFAITADDWRAAGFDGGPEIRLDETTRTQPADQLTDAHIKYLTSTHLVDVVETGR